MIYAQYQLEAHPVSIRSIRATGRRSSEQSRRDVSIDKVTENSCNDQYILYPYSIPLHIRRSI